MRWQEQYKDRLITAEEAARMVKSGDVVVFPILMQIPDIVSALVERRGELRNVTVICEWVQDYPWLHPGMQESFAVKDLFPSKFGRQGIEERWIDFVPVNHGTIDSERQAEQGRSPLYLYADIVFVKLTPPDTDGYCSFGHYVFTGPAAIRTAKTVIATIDPNLIWSHGDHIHISELDYLVEMSPTELGRVSYTGASIPAEREGEMADVIGANIASLIRDGDTLEVGIGTPSEACIQFLDTKNDLGMDTEVIYPRAIGLMRAGVITGKRKNVNKGKVVCTGLLVYEEDPGSSAAMDYVNHNEMFKFIEWSSLVKVPRIASNDNMVTVNTIIGIDLTGQIDVTNVGPRVIAGIGGQLEYHIGAHYSRGGRAISAMMSTAKAGTVSRVVPQFEAGTVIAIPNFYADYLVTEHGIVSLSGKSQRERAEAIISVADPKFQPELKEAARKLFWP